MHCLGDCGSAMNKFLIDCTNLRILTMRCSPRIVNVQFGRAPKYFYGKLAFDTNAHEELFQDLFLDHMKQISSGGKHIDLDEMKKLAVSLKRLSADAPTSINSFPIFGKDDPECFSHQCLFL